MLYDFDLKFETELLVVSGDKALNDLLMKLNMPKLEKSGSATVEHTMSINNASFLPTNDVIEKYKQVIFECMTENFNGLKDNYSVKVIETRFIGIVNLTQKEE